MSKFEQFRTELERVKQEAARQQDKENAERADAETAFWQTTEKALLAAIKELSIEEYLIGLRDEVWRLGEVTLTPPDTPPEKDRLRWENLKWAEINARYKLEASWPTFVEGGPANFDLDGYTPTLSDRVEETGVSLEVTVSAHGDSVTVFVSSTYTSGGVLKEQFKYHKKEDVQKLNEILLRDCLNRTPALPYDQTKKKSEEEIVRRGLKSELRKYRLSR